MGRGGRLIGLMVLGLAAFAACAPGAGRTTSFAGLTGAVTVTRDQWGVPHIRAGSDLDAVYGLGYAHAQDRLWQMELNRRVGAGRLSEILGRGALEQDRFLRTWGFYRAALAALPSLEPRTAEFLRAYAAGVNAFISAGDLPVEFTLTGAKPEPWQPADSLVWAKMLAYDLSANWQDELENAQIAAKLGLEGLNALKPGYPQGQPTVIKLEDYAGAVNLPGLAAPPAQPATLEGITIEALRRVDAIRRTLPVNGFERDTGSNNWVVAGSRTLSGKPLLANDPHLSFSAPSIWYLADIKGATLSAVGATLPGLPAVVLGRNERVAWGATNTAPDTQDLFTLDLKDGAFQTPSGSVKLETRMETIKVGNGEEQLRVRVAPGYGPLISDLGGTASDNGQAVALRYVSLEPGDTTLDAFIGFNYAQSGADFVAAARRYIAPQQNFVYADLNGTIGYIAPGKIPVRDWNGALPASAARGQNWREYRAFAELPQVVNPREGFIVTANNRTLPFQSAQPEFSTYTEPYRAQRIRERLLENPRQTVESMKDIQADSVSLVARDLVPDLLALVPKSDAARRLQAAVRDWDLRADLRSTGATASAFYYRELTRIVSDELGAEFKYYNEPVFLIPALRANSRFCLDSGDATVKSCADFRARALERGALALEARLGSDPVQWRWERLHVAQFNAVIGAAPLVGPLFNRSLPTNGSFLTVNVGAYNQDTFAQRSGPSYRAVYDLGAPDASQYMHPLGQSGDVFSKHYDDLLRPWRDGATIPMSQRAMDWGAVTVTTLQP